MFSMKVISAMEKCFLDQTPGDFPVLSSVRFFHNERGTIQVTTYNPDETDGLVNLFHVRIDGDLAPFASIHTVENIVNYAPSYGTPKRTAEADPTFLRTTPGLYPDILANPMRKDCVPVLNQQLHTFYVDFEGDMKPGTYPTKIRLVDNDERPIAETEIEIGILDMDLPEQDTRVTNWFYADCLADYYNVPAFSDRHFEICEAFIRRAVENGDNMILTPIFTVALDTAVGWERTTTQLLGVKKDNGVYSFDFTLVDRWIEMCERCGVKYYEICHLFTQWGASHAPKIMATVDGEYKQIFGWDTDAFGAEYVGFLDSFLPAFTAYMEAKGLKDRTYFHISDEPGGDHLENYKTNRRNVDKWLKGWKILDALSHVEFYQQGLVEIPVPSESAIDDFMKEDIKERWVYYCCGPWVKASNRFVAMSLPRARSIGIQMYKYGIEGFLHWGYNFYNNCMSYDKVNPFLNPCAGYWGITGDALVVYPGQDGKPLDSIRLRALAKGIEDVRVLKLAEQYCGKEKVVETMEKIVGPVSFKWSVNSATLMEELRSAVIDLILANR